MKNTMNIKNSTKSKIPDSKFDSMNRETKEQLRKKIPSKETLYNTWEVIGNSLRERREQLKYKKVDIAELLNIDVKTVSNHETANTTPSFETLLQYCSIYDCDLGYLLKEYEGTTYQRNEISKIIGLDDESICILMNNDGSIRRNDLNHNYINFIIKDSKEKDSLSYRIIRFMARYKTPENKYFSEIAPFYEGVLKWADEIHDPYEVPRLLAKIEALNPIIKAYFKEKGLSNEEVEDIEERTEGFFESYFYSKVAQEFELNNLKYEANRYIDKYLKGEE